MKTKLLSLLLLTGLLSPAIAETETSHTGKRIFSTSPRTELSITTTHKAIPPKKKHKKKRKTILDHKMKMRNGHHCPSF